MKRHWQITLAALLVAVSTTDVASACGLTRGLFGRRCAYRVAATSGPYGGWSTGSTAGTVSRDLPTCSGGACEAEKQTDDAETPPLPTCVATTCETSSLTESEIALGLRLVEEANRARVTQGLRPLELDERFVGGARAHSQVMASWRSCFHLYPPTPEICAAWQTSPEAAVQDWTLSGGHAAILFGARYTKIAPGVAHDAEGRLYWTLRIW